MATIRTCIYGYSVAIKDLIPVLALCLSVISLAWQTWSWKSSGPKVTLEVLPGRKTVFSFSGEPTEAQRQHNEKERRWKGYFFVKVRNHGRAATTIEDIRIGFKRGAAVDIAPHVVQERSSETMPFRLDAAASGQWFFSLDAAIDDLRADLRLHSGHSSHFVLRRDLWVIVTLGGGKEISEPLTEGYGPISRFWERVSLAAMFLVARRPRPGE